MRILVVDDQESFGSLLGRTLKRLGHKPLLVVDPRDALEALRSESVDAVITDIDMPIMNGVDLARAIQSSSQTEIPIAFCTGSVRDSDVVREASEIGTVLPKVWTVADVKDLIAGLRAPSTLPRRRLARGSSPTMEREGVVGQRRAPTNREHADRGAPRRGVCRVRVSCASWAQVDKLCRNASAGKNTVAVRGAGGLAVDDAVIVALALPDELVLSVKGRVVDVTTDAARAEPIHTVRLLGLTPELCDRLRAMAAEAGGAASGRGPAATSGGDPVARIRRRDR